MIRAEGLGKKYVIGHQAERVRNVTLREAMTRVLGAACDKTLDLLRGRAIVAGETTEVFWALKDINFEVKRGEVLGIIGRNGAGKSTLLKILSRITEPTVGRVTIRGRVASLLEVGTGFHAELSGRENIFLNGAILGMSRAEVRRKFDEIVAFAEVERFLDTPVKRYSSGMYVRLAFAVAAHLEPEILIVDEVLAVGDVEFQKRCLGKMSDVASGGRTVLFVSHNLTAVERLCQTSILLKNGRIAASGPVSKVIQAYQDAAASGGPVQDLAAITARSGEGRVRFARVEIYGRAEGEVPVTGGDLNIMLQFSANPAAARPSRIGIAIASSFGERLIVCSTEMTCADLPKVGNGARFLCHIPALPLTGGHYLLTLFVEQNGVVEDWIPDACRFAVTDADYFGAGKNIPAGHEGRTVLVGHSWRSVMGAVRGIASETMNA